MRGRQTQALRPDQIRRLEAFRRAPHEGAPHGYSLPQLRMAMGAGFGWQTLKKALQGQPVWDLHYSYIAQWLDRYLPLAGLAFNGKSASAGEREFDEDAAPMGDGRARSVDQQASDEIEDEPNKKTPGATGTVRGSR